MISIFLSYRREDSRHQAGRLYDRLVAHFGSAQVFKDVDSIPLGRDFREILTERVANCDVLLAVIGDTWLSAIGKKGGRRLDDPIDFVRIEIEAALNRNIVVIPVLVGNLTVPQAEDMPESLRRLSFRNGLHVRPDPDFHNDMDRLIRGIEAAVEAPKKRSTSRDPKTRGPEALKSSKTHSTVDPLKEPRGGHNPRTRPWRLSFHLIAIATGLLTLAVAGWLIFIATDKGSIRVTFRETGLSLTLDGFPLQSEQVAASMPLRAGMHLMVVKRGETIVKEEHFRVLRGIETTLAVGDLPIVPETALTSPVATDSRPKTSSTNMSRIVIFGPGGPDELGNMNVSWEIMEENGKKSYLPGRPTPFREKFMRGNIYPIKLSDISGRPTLQLYSTIELAPSTSIFDNYSNSNIIPIQFTSEDLDRVENGEFITKVYYIPTSATPLETEAHGEKIIRSLFSTQATKINKSLYDEHYGNKAKVPVWPAEDLASQAAKLGTVLLTLRLGGINQELDHIVKDINSKSQIVFFGPGGPGGTGDMKIGWYSVTPIEEKDYPPGRLTPFRHNFMQGYKYRLKLSEISGRPSAILYATIEIPFATPATLTYLTHNLIPVQFTAEDIDQIEGGKFVTKVYYLSNSKFENPVDLPTPMIANQMDAGQYAILEAQRHGTIMAILKIEKIVN